jgi:hypothetical protein
VTFALLAKFLYLHLEKITALAMLRNHIKKVFSLENDGGHYEDHRVNHKS